MARFTVRVELHNADSSDYDDLHDKMESNGFSTEINGGNDTTFKLPSAEYNYSSNKKSCKEVRDKAFDIARSVNNNPKILVTESASRAWKNLENV